jgi:hypothetical protein
MRKGREKKAHCVLVGKPKGRIILLKPAQKWEENTKWILQTCNVRTKPIWFRTWTYGRLS